MTEYFRPHCAVYLILIKGDQVLLSKRANTGYKDGYYSLPAGHVEQGETPTQAIVREAAEEIGIGINSQDLTFTTVLYRSTADRTYVDFFFKCSIYQGQPYNKEPGKCSEIIFFPTGNLPPNTLDYVKGAIIARIGNEYQEI